MKLFTPLVVLATVGTALCAPVTSSTELSARNRILSHLRNIWADAYDCRAKSGSYVAGCFQQETTFNVQNIQVDGNQDFTSWKSDLLYDFNYLRTEFQHELQQFDKNYQIFKNRVYPLLTFFAQHGYYNAQLAAWDLRYHLALIWEAAAYLDQDIRNDLYTSLVNLSTHLHATVGAQYTEYPRSVSAVLVQIETVYDFYYPPTDVSYNTWFLPIHQQIFRYVSSAKSADYMQDISA